MNNIPRGRQGRMYARMHFIAQCVNRKVTDNVYAANAWYVANDAHKLPVDDAIAKFKEWLQ